MIRDFQQHGVSLARIVTTALLSLGLLSCGGTVTRKRVTPQELVNLRSIPVTIEGTLRSAYMTDDSCYYTEWAYGVMTEDASVSLTPAYQSSDSILVVTPHGVMLLDIFDVKLYLGAYFSRTFSSENASIAPLPIQKLVEKEGGIIAVHEFLLRPEQTYYAQVRREFAPGTDSAETAGVRSRLVVELSDRPFEGETPQRGPTPSYNY